MLGEICIASRRTPFQYVCRPLQLMGRIDILGNLLIMNMSTSLHPNNWQQIWQPQSVPNLWY